MSKQVRHAMGDSLLGQLQRGRGAGFLVAGRKLQRNSWPLLVECITHDPRLDSQIESREDYYAALVVETGMDLDALAIHLREHDDVDKFGWNTPLTVCTLGALARRDYRDSVTLLRDYVAWGRWWDLALEELVSTECFEIWADLHEALYQRIGSKKSTEEELAQYSTAVEPWRTWCKHNTRLSGLIGNRLFQGGDSEQFQKHDYTNLTVADLLQLAGQDGRIRYKLRGIIAHVVKPADFEFLVSQVSAAEPWRSAVALAGLAKLANPAMFDWLRDFWSSNTKMPGVLRARIEEAMMAMPPTRTLPLARDWMNHREWHFRRLAEEILEHHATIDDVPLLRRAITSALADDAANIYRLCSLIEAFKHLPASGRIPELEWAFREFRYSYGRARAADALFVTDRGFFDRTYAFECLWDCEEKTRELACAAVNLASNEARERLDQLSKDVREDESVRNAAAKRLS